MMNPNILNQNPLMFFDRAVNAQRSQLLTVMADAVSECRTAADQAAELNETGQVGLLRLAEVWSAIRAKEGMGGLILEGTEAKILSDVVAQFYAYLSGCMFNDPVGMAIYAELHYMMSSLMLGEWFEYLWQTVENKQKFISQIMTSKSPVRSCDDVDETALSFAEIKALCAGDPRIKERMDLDVEVSRLKLMKADHQSKQYRLEDQLLKYFPEEIEKHKGFIKGFESDLEVLAAHPHPEDGFAGMEIRGDLLTDKENAGAALLDACKEVKTSDPVQIGSYRGYAMSVEFSAWKQEYTLLLKGQMTHRATLGTDPRGNLTRIDNALAQMPQRLEAAKAQLDNLYQQQAAAKEEVGKPFLYEEELKSKNARLVELDTLLNIDGKGPAHDEAVVAKSTRPSVLNHLKRPVPPRSTDKKPKQHEEVR